MLGWLRTMGRARTAPAAPRIRSVIADAFLRGDDVASLGGVPSVTGLNISMLTAMQQSAVYACVRIRSRDVARCTPTVLREVSHGNFEIVKNHELSKLFRRPNRLQTWFEFCEQQTMNGLMRGNEYAVKLRDRGGRVTELIPINPDWVSLWEAPGGLLFYQVSRQGLWMMNVLSDEPWMIPQEDMLHIRDLSLNTLLGLSRIALARDTIGLAMAQEQQAARFVGNGARPAGILQTDKMLTEEAAERLRKRWESIHAGLSNAGKTAVLEDGIKFAQVQLTSVDLEFIQQRQMSIREIARFFDVPIHKLQEQDNIPKANMSELNADYVQNTVMSDLARREQRYALEWELADDMSVKFDEGELLRADMKTQVDTARMMLLAGIASPNEARERLGYGPKTGNEEGPDALYIPTNLSPNGSAIDGVAPDGAGRPPAGSDPPPQAGT